MLIYFKSRNSYLRSGRLHTITSAITPSAVIQIHPSLHQGDTYVWAKQTVFVVKVNTRCLKRRHNVLIPTGAASLWKRVRDTNGRVSRRDRRKLRGGKPRR